ncbi:MAG: type II secretion system protein GspM [Motiliproteus sp.]
MQKLQQWEDRFNAMSQRERVLVLVTLMVALAFPAYIYLIEPAQQDSVRYGNSLQQLKTTQAQAEVDYQLALAAKIEDPNIALQAKIDRLQQQVSANTAQIKQRSASLVTPHEMVSMLQQLLIGHKGVRLIGVRKLAPISVLNPVAAEEVEEKDVAAASKGEGATSESLPVLASGLYRHDLELQVEGDFFQVLGFLESVEQANRSMFWDGFDYHVDEYPKARVQLKVYTLSTTQEWLGV